MLRPCVRFTQRFSWSELHGFMDLPGLAIELTRRYNVAPGQDVAVVRLQDGERRLSELNWGLIPSWSPQPQPRRPINARAETVAGKPMFRSAFRARRCLVPADGYYEWARRGGFKQPHLTTRGDGGPMAFAGLWERWRRLATGVHTDSPAGAASEDTLETFTILTTAATTAVATVHHRMPVILPPSFFGSWL